MTENPIIMNVVDQILDICNSIDNVKEYYATLGKTNDYKKYISISVNLTKINCLKNRRM